MEFPHLLTTLLAAPAELHRQIGATLQVIEACDRSMLALVRQAREVLGGSAPGLRLRIVQQQDRHADLGNLPVRMLSWAYQRTALGRTQAQVRQSLLSIQDAGGVPVFDGVGPSMQAELVAIERQALALNQWRRLQVAHCRALQSSLHLAQRWMDERPALRRAVRDSGKSFVMPGIDPACAADESWAVGCSYPRA